MTGTSTNNKTLFNGGAIKKQPPLKKGKPRGIRRDRDCFTCRNRGVKCDLNRPNCTPCLDANVRCEGYPSRLIWSAPVDHHLVSQSRTKPISTTAAATSGSDGADTTTATSSTSTFSNITANDPLYVVSTNVSNPSSTNSTDSNTPISYNFNFNSAPTSSTVRHRSSPSISPASDVASLSPWTTNSNFTSSGIGSVISPDPVNISVSATSSTAGSSTGSTSTTSQPGNITYSHISPHNPHLTLTSRARNPSSISIKSESDDPSLIAFLETSPHLNKSLLPGIAFSFKKEHNPFAHLEEPPDQAIGSNEDDEVDPMRISNFLWGIKAILTAFNHAKQTNTIMKSQKGFEKSEVLSTIWKFVSACLDYNNKNTLDAELNSLQLRANAIEELQTFINNGVIEAIFSILAFTYFDVCQGSFGAWHRHLQGARSLLDLHCTNKQQLLQSFTNTPGLQHAVTLLNWYDVTGVIAAPNRSLIFESWHRESIDDKFFSLVGCPKSIFLTIPEIYKDTTCPAKWVAVALNEVLLIDPIESSYVDRAGNAWKYACLMMALERSSGGSITTPTISSNSTFQSLYSLPMETLVGKVTERITAIPFDTALSQHLAVVVFMVARNAVKEEHRQIVRRYWHFWSSEKFPLYADALWQCEQWWSKPLSQTSTPRSASETSHF